MDSNKVSVKIYGQEYTITGEKPREQIVKIAAYVDNKMYEISEIVTPGPESSLAVLSSVNICDEYFDLLDEIEELNVMLVYMVTKHKRICTDFTPSLKNQQQWST